MLSILFSSQEQMHLTLYALGMLWESKTTWAPPHERLEGMITDLMILKPTTIKEARDSNPQTARRNERFTALLCNYTTNTQERSK